jgi:RNA polymerase sigma-70 factor (ECF subfamily)
MDTKQDVGHAPDAGEQSIKALAAHARGEAWAALAQQYGHRLYVHAWCILKDGHEARDVVQEVFIRAMREPRLFEADFRLQAWLYRVTRNLCFNLVRDRRRRDGILAAVPQAVASEVDPVARVLGGERAREVIEAIDRLSADHRTILRLRYYDDLSYAEIARALSLKIGTVMSRLSRARDRLLDVLGELPDPLVAS